MCYKKETFGDFWINSKRSTDLAEGSENYKRWKDVGKDPMKTGGNNILEQFNRHVVKC